MDSSSDQLLPAGTNDSQTAAVASAETDETRVPEIAIQIPPDQESEVTPEVPLQKSEAMTEAPPQKPEGEEFSHAVDCTQVDPPVQVCIEPEVIQPASNSPNSESERESTEQDGRVREGWFFSYCRLASTISDKPCIFPLQLLFFGIPFSAAVMGVKYYNECPMNSAVPLSLVILGIIGATGAIAKCLMTLKFLLIKDRSGLGISNYMSVLATLIMLVIVLTQDMTFFAMDPSFDQGANNFCHPAFYHYAYWLLIIGPIAIVFMMFVNGPACLFSNTDVQCQ